MILRKPRRLELSAEEDLPQYLEAKRKLLAQYIQRYRLRLTRHPELASPDKSLPKKLPGSPRPGPARPADRERQGSSPEPPGAGRSRFLTS